MELTPALSCSKIPTDIFLSRSFAMQMITKTIMCVLTQIYYFESLLKEILLKEREERKKEEKKTFIWGIGDSYK